MKSRLLELAVGLTCLKREDADFAQALWEAKGGAVESILTERGLLDEKTLAWLVDILMANYGELELSSLIRDRKSLKHLLEKDPFHAGAGWLARKQLSQWAGRMPVSLEALFREHGYDPAALLAAGKSASLRRGTRRVAPKAASWGQAPSTADSESSPDGLDFYLAVPAAQPGGLILHAGMLQRSAVALFDKLDVPKQNPSADGDLDTNTVSSLY